MSPRDFCYWLQGAFEIAGLEGLTAAQVSVIKNHLNLVFKHEIDTPDPTGELQKIHDGKQPQKTGVPGIGSNPYAEISKRPPGVRC